MDAAKQGGATEEMHIWYVNEGLYSSFSVVVIECFAQNSGHIGWLLPQIICRSKRHGGRECGGSTAVESFSVHWRLQRHQQR